MRRNAYVGTVAATGGGDQQQPYNFGTGTHTFTVPRSGFWKFVVWGEGGGAAGADTKGAASGAYAEKTKRLSAGQTVTVAVPSNDTNNTVDGYNGATTIVTFPDATTVTCTGGTRGASPTGGTATGGDVNISGSANNVVGGGTNGGGINGASQALNGGGAPANLPYRGGDGGGSIVPRGGTPGAGGLTGAPGGPGAVLAVFIHD
jgi:hypothetical protein